MITTVTDNPKKVSGKKNKIKEKADWPPVLNNRKSPKKKGRERGIKLIIRKRIRQISYPIAIHHTGGFNGFLPTKLYRRV